MSPFLVLVLAKPFRAAPFDQIVREEMRLQRAPGVGVAIVVDGKPVLVKGYGEANVELHVPVKPETLFQSGSIGKQFTATLIMLLAKDGRLSLHDPITKWFPEGDQVWRGVTIYHLLTHTSGLPDAAYNSTILRRDYTDEELVRLVASRPLVDLPGTKYRYCNSGYMLLGILIKRLTGKFYGELLQKWIFDPLGMKTARVISESDIVPNRAAGYQMTDDGLKNQTYISPSLNQTADGSLYLSLLDYIQWDKGLRDANFLKPASLKQTWTPAMLSDSLPASFKTSYDGTVGYGFGWNVPLRFKGHFVEHPGAWQGFTTYFGRRTDRSLSVVVLMNLDAKHALPNRIGRRILSLLSPDLTPISYFKNDW